MQEKYYPDKEAIVTAIRNDDPLLVLVSFDETEILLSNIDDSMEHHILLKQLGYRESDLDKYFRLVVNSEGADWTFVCPSGYAEIHDRDRRIRKYYNDGIDTISRALKQLAFNAAIHIPNRYRRHLNTLAQ